MTRISLRLAISTALMLVTLFALFVGFSSIVLGWQFNTVMSGSMDPTLKVGDIIVSQPANPEAIEVGDIITYYSPQLGKTIVHRVIEKHVGSEVYASSRPNGDSQLYLKTQGDANENPDPEVVPAQNVVGKVGFHVPFLGHVLQSLKTPLGTVLLFAVPGVAIIGMEIKNIRFQLSKLRNGRYAVANAEIPATKRWTAGLRTEDWIAPREVANSLYVFSESGALRPLAFAPRALV